MPLKHIDTYIFDLDNTLYHPSTGIMDDMGGRINQFISELHGISVEEAAVIRRNYWLTYGTTLHGLIEHDNINPVSYLDYIHDIDLTAIKECTSTRAGIEKLQGEKVVFTNSNKEYAEKVLEQLGIADIFDGLYDTSWANYVPKPNKEPYERLIKELGVDPKKCLMLEDSVVNLKTAHDMGMTTVLIHEDEHNHEHVHHQEPCIVTWLDKVTK